MPINASFEFVRAQGQYLKASTTEEKLTALKLMLSTAPRHKGAQKLLDQLKRKYADLRKELYKEKRAGKGKSFAIKKEGAAQVAVLGTINSGKSETFNLLTNSSDKASEYELRMRMIPHENVWLQGIDLPAIYEGFSEAPNAGQIFGLVRNVDFMVLVVNGEDAENQLKLLLKELEKSKVHPCKTKSYENFIYHVPAIIAYTNKLAHLKIDFEQFYYLDKEKLIATIWSKLGKIRVQTRTRGKTADKPIILAKGTTVKSLAEAVHKDFVRKFRYAKVWGPSADFAGQQIGLDHKLKDRDIVEIYLK